MKKTKGNVLTLSKEEKLELNELIAEDNKKSQKVMNKQEKHHRKAKTLLGYCSRMLGSKSGYSRAYPANVVVFNSNVCTKDGKIWYGDIDITLEEETLKTLAKMIKEPIYVLYEMDGRFENEENPLIEKAVYSVTPDEEFKIYEYAERCKRGKLKGKLIMKKEYRY